MRVRGHRSEGFLAIWTDRDGSNSDKFRTNLNNRIGFEELPVGRNNRAGSTRTRIVEDLGDGRGGDGRVNFPDQDRIRCVRT